MSSESIEFDSHGDIKLDITKKDSSGPTIFTACSRALARASPVFDRMLYGNFVEARDSSTSICGDWIVKLPEDKASPLAVFLYIIHGHFYQVPKILTIEEIYDLTVLTNYYDSTRVLAPWTNSWMASIDEDATDSNASMAKVLWISWELGRKETFSRMARRMLMETQGPFAADDDIFQDLQMPPSIIERISETRVLTIQALLDVFRDMVNNLIVVDEGPRWCHHATWMGPHRCESMILGSMTFCLARAGIWPLPNPIDVHDSLVGLYRKLTNLIIHDIGQVTERPPIDHRECNPSSFLLEQVERRMGDIANPVTDFHRQYLEDQSQKLAPL